MVRVRGVPEVQRGEKGWGRLPKQARQPVCAVGAEATVAAECHVADALGPHATHHPHASVRAHLTQKSYIEGVRSGIEGRGKE